MDALLKQQLKIQTLNDFFDFLDTINIAYNFFNDKNKHLCPVCASDNLAFDESHDTFECCDCGVLRDDPIEQKECFDLSAVIEMFCGKTEEINKK